MDENYGQDQNWQDSNQDLNPNQPNQSWQNPYQGQQNQNWRNPYQNNYYSGYNNGQQNNGYPNMNGYPISNMPGQGYANNGSNAGYNNYVPNNYNGPIVVSNAVAPKSGGLAVGSLVCGIISVLGFWSVITIILSIVGVVLGAVNNAQDNPNKGMAIAGIILSILGFLLSIFFIVIMMEMI